MILHPPKPAVFWAGGLAGACRRRPCSSRFNRQDDHPRGCTAGPSMTRPPSGLPPPSSSWRCPSTRPRPPSRWQEQRLAVLTQRAGLLFHFIFKWRILLHLLEARKERDGPVLVHAQGRVVGSAARALWSCCVRCVRVRPCDHEARSNVCSDNQGTCREYQKALERQYNDICARARVDEARRFMGETARIFRFILRCSLALCQQRRVCSPGYSLTGSACLRAVPRGNGSPLRPSQAQASLVRVECGRHCRRAL